MSELAKQATEGMTDDLLGSAVLAEAVHRKALGTLEFEDQTYNCLVELTYERNGKHGRGEYYRVEAIARPENRHSGQQSSRRFDDRGDAEEEFEHQVEKWDLEEQTTESEDTTEDDTDESNVSVLDRLRDAVHHNPHI